MNMFEKLLVAFKSDGFWIHFARFGIVGTIIHIHGTKAENGTSGKVDAITLHLDSSRREEREIRCEQQYYGFLGSPTHAMT